MPVTIIDYISWETPDMNILQILGLFKLGTKGALLGAVAIMLKGKLKLVSESITNPYVAFIMLQQAYTLSNKNSPISMIYLAGDSSVIWNQIIENETELTLLDMSIIKIKNYADLIKFDQLTKYKLLLKYYKKNTGFNSTKCSPLIDKIKKKYNIDNKTILSLIKEMNYMPMSKDDFEKKFSEYPKFPEIN